MKLHIRVGQPQELSDLKFRLIKSNISNQIIINLIKSGSIARQELAHCREKLR